MLCCCRRMTRLSTQLLAFLEEMSVTCERPLDGVSAAQKLNSQSFDLVLVDCENLPAAKLIFDVCRRGKNGNNPVPIAIVDGRAGLPTAFRLGAELILTKPVAKDQARSTIRTAVGRVRKRRAPGECPRATGKRGPSQHNHERPARAGSGRGNRFSAADELCRPRSNLCSQRRHNDAVRTRPLDEDAVRSRRSHYRARDSRFRSENRLLFTVIGGRVFFGSIRFRAFEIRKPLKTFRRSGAR
jgi:DNA-binding response OmpR family regulator